MAGAMSGTSADGVDVALCAITGRGTRMSQKLILHHAHPYPSELRRKIFTLRETSHTSLADLAGLGRDISLNYAQAVRRALQKAQIEAREITAIAAHGQTLFHAPPLTIQWLDPALLAYETGCAVVSDFRRADCAAGGQGAPLVPFADYVLFRDEKKNRTLVNLGGIANVTLIPAGGGIDSLLAFDTGPANCISDHLMRLHDPNGPGVDIDGQIASTASPNLAVVDRVLSAAYFRAAPPKSTDGPEMIEIFKSAGGMGLSLPAALATACQITASALADALRRFSPNLPQDLIVSGGGAKNPTILRLLREELRNTPVRTLEEVGVPGEAKEAIAFALLGAATLDEEVGNVPSCTGANRGVVLGMVTPKP
jgi:anhydro-N-acetylmuramic acid kinase